MKAILINSIKREVYGIEFEMGRPLELLFSSSKSLRQKIPVDLERIDLWPTHSLFFDKNAVFKFPADYFYIEGYQHPIFGKGIVFRVANANGNFEYCSAELLVRDVSPLVGFHDKTPNRIKGTYLNRNGDAI